MNSRYNIKWLLIGVLVLGITEATGLAQTGQPSGASGGPVSGSDQQIQAQNLLKDRGQKQVDLFTGGFSYSVPITCAPARNNSEPHLSLGYSSSAENGWCGMGWNLEIGYIERNTRAGFPIQYSTAATPGALPDYQDTNGFIMNLFGKSVTLLPVGNGEYDPEVDTDFIRCFLNTSGGEDQWTVYDKSGNVYFFGESSGTRVTNPRWSGSGTGESQTFYWALDQIVTPTGDQTTIAYTSQSQKSPYTGQPQNVLYPTQITYNGHIANFNNNGYDAGYSGQYTISFQTEARSDWRLFYNWGFRTEQDYLLSSVVCKAGTQCVSSNSLTYMTSPATGRSLLTNVVTYGFDANNNPYALPAQTFTYQFNTNAVTFGPVILWTNLVLTNLSGSGGNNPAISEVNGSGTIADLVDIDGDGLPDRVSWANTNSPNFYMVQKNLGMQANGNGMFGAGYGFGPTSTGPLTGNQQPSASNPCPDDTAYANLNSQYGRLRDINGDGLPDRVEGYWATANSIINGGVLVPFTNFEVQLNLGEGFSTPVTNWPVSPGPLPTSSTWAPDYYCVESGGVNVGLFDINGDGLPDRVMSEWYQNGPMTNFLVQFNTGVGFTPPVNFGPYRSQNFNSLSAGAAPYDWAGIEVPAGTSGFAEAHMIDINGDGLPDRIMTAMNPSEPGTALTSPTYYAVEYNDGYSFESTNTSTGYGGASDQWPGQAALAADNGGNTFNSGEEANFAIVNLPFVGLFDVNGDGLPDRVMLDWAHYQTATNWLVFLNNGHGFDNTPITVSNIYSPIDIGPSYVPTYWGMESSLQGYGQVTGLIDINGDGLLDRVMSVYYSGVGTPLWPSNCFLVQLNTGPYPDLMTNVNNGLGGNIGITYRPSTTYDNRVNPADPNSGSHMPFVRYVTSSVTASDGVNPPQTTTYSYGGGYYNGSRREFEGFAVVTNTDPLARYTVTYFHTDGGRNYSSLGEFQDTNSITGFGYFAKVGMPYRVETYGNDNQLYHVQVNQVTNANLGNGRFFPYTMMTFDCDYAPASGTSNVTAMSFAYDLTDGNLTNKYLYGQVSGFSAATFSYADPDPTDNRYYQYVYATLPNNAYIRDHPAAVILADGNNNVVQETTCTYYDYSGTLETKNVQICPSPVYYSTTSYTYNGYGLRSVVTDPVGVQTTITYDSTYNMYPYQITVGPSGNSFTTTTFYDPRSGELSGSINPVGVAITNMYDQFCRLTESEKTPVGGSQFVTETDSYQLKPISAGIANSYDDAVVNDGVGGLETRTYYDGFMRPIETCMLGEDQSSDNQNFRVVATAYDAEGHAFLTTWPRFMGSVNFTLPSNLTQPSSHVMANWIGYDPDGRVCSNCVVSATFNVNGSFISGEPSAGDVGTSPLGVKKWAYTFNSDPWWLVCTDEDDDVSRYHLDAFGQTNVIQEVNGTSTYLTTNKYDLAGNLTNIINANQENIYFAYDQAGNLIASADPYLGQWTYQRDVLGRLRVQTDARLDVVSNSYVNSAGSQDPLGRLQVQTVFSPNYKTHTLTPAYTNTYLYDTSYNQNYPIYRGLLYEIIDSQGVETNGYDTLGRLAITTRHLNINNQNYTVTYAYDQADHVTNISYPNGGPTIGYSYWHGGSIDQVYRNGSAPQYNYYSVNANEYDQFEHVLQFSYGNGLTTTRGYYSTSERLQDVSCAVFNRSFQYTAAGDINLLSGTGLGGGGRVDVAYDGLHRILSYTGLNGQYGYDSVGSILKNIEGEGSAYTYANTRPQAVIVAYGVTNLYDLCGNMIVRHGGPTGPQAMEYDPQNRLVAFSQAGTVSAQFGYGADGTRLWEETDNNPNQVQVWIGQIYEEKNDSQGVRHILFHVFAGDDLVCTFEAGSSLAQSGGNTADIAYYYHEDNLNTSSALSYGAGSQMGQQAEVDAYYPFGSTVAGTLQAPFQVSRRFTGQLFDAETGLYYYGSAKGPYGRYFDPGLGRFIQPDQMIADFRNPQSYNRYSYCVDDPLVYNDPTGKDPSVLTAGSAQAILMGDDDQAAATVRWAKSAAGVTAATLRTAAEANPIVGAADGAIGATTGKDAITGQKLTKGQRVLSGISAATSVVPGGIEAKEGEKITADVIESGAANRATFEAYKDTLRAGMSRPAAADTELNSILDKVYRANAQVGSGSTAAAVRQEKATGQPVGGLWHTQKAQDSINALQNWLVNKPNASTADRAAAENVIKDLQNALNGK